MINECAVGDHDGQLTSHMPRDPGNSGWASIVKTPRKDTDIVVRMLTLDDYVRSNGISKVSLVKLHIEGAETMAITGMAELLAGSEAPSLIVEVNPFLLERQGNNARLITVRLADLGFKLYAFKSGALRLIDPRQTIRQQTNLLASKRTLSLPLMNDGCMTYPT